MTTSREDRSVLDLPAPGPDPVRQPHPATPVTIVHGTADEIVPLDLARSYVAAHPATRLVAVDGGHFVVIDPRSAAWPELLAALSAS